MGDNLRILYDTFLDSGELFDILPEATGIWLKDKETFEGIYSNLDTSLLETPKDDFFKDEEDPYVEDDYIGY